MQQVETALRNKGLLLIEFAWISRQIGGYLLLCMGLLEGLTALIFFVTSEDVQKKFTYALILSGVLMTDAFLLHLPFSEQERNLGKEFEQFTLNFGIMAGLFMVTGLRDWKTAAPAAMAGARRKLHHD